MIINRLCYRQFPVYNIIWLSTYKVAMHSKTYRLLCCVKQMSLYSTSNRIVKQMNLLQQFQQNNFKHFSSDDGNVVDYAISSKELKEELSTKDFYLIDVREPHEVETYGKIEGACNIPMNEVEFALGLSEEIFENKYNVEKPSDAGENVVFYCQAGIRSMHVLVLARDLGYDNAKHLTGGYASWKDEE